MNKERKAALDILGIVSRSTGWAFDMEQGDGSYLIQTSRQTQEGKIINVFYLVEDGSVLLAVSAPDCRFNHKYVRNRVAALPQEQPVDVIEIGNYSVVLTCLMDLDDFEREMNAIAVDLMADMVNAMADIIENDRRKKK